jgi:hypothetical protein
MTTALLVDALTSASFDSMPRPVVTANSFAPSLALAAWWPCCAVGASRAEAAPHPAAQAQKPQMHFGATLVPTRVQ